MARHAGRLVGDLVEQTLHQGRQAAGADILDRAVDLLGEERDLVDSLGNPYRDYRENVPMLIPFTRAKTERGLTPFF